MIKKPISLYFFISALIFAAVAPAAYAHCPLCTAAVGAAAVSAKYYGMDVTIIGLLIGAFGVSTGLWIGLKLKKFFRFQLPLIVAASFLLTVIPLMYIDKSTVYLPLLFFGLAGSLLNKVYWLNKILFGSIIGGIVTTLAYASHTAIKKVNGKVLFPFQGIALTLAFLLASGTVLYLTYAA
ncbi:hypothetical protein HYS31_08665 [Candidatus Woesearchaeota archaeon]|nr:hypothetical protein [Candidatus Woesearchaeota archaeon]